MEDWATLAYHTNAAFEAAREAGEPTEGPFDAFDGLRQQMEYSEALRRQTRVDDSRHNRTRSAELLGVYAPEVREALREAAAIRTEVVHKILIDYDEATRAGKVNEDELASTAAHLRSAAESLRHFITESFPIDGS